MAKSKSGGTRSYIRGRVGADVYSIGKDAKGKKQQVVRSLAESVANPRTTAQMAGRMIMASVMQALSAMKSIIDHSFDGVSAGQPSLSEFISRNYALVKEDASANPASGNSFGLNMYQEKGAKPGAYVVAAGKATLPAVLEIDGAGIATITVNGDALSVANLKSSLGLSTEEYFTLLGFDAGNEFGFVRVRISPNADDATIIDGSNVNTIFAIDGSITPSFALNGSSIVITTGLTACSGIIVSRKSASGYIHNDAKLSMPVDPEWPAIVALASYPTGSQRFLNGGSIAGESEIVPDAPEVQVTLRATALSVGGTSRTIGYSDMVNNYPQTKALVITLSGEPTDGSCKIVQSGNTMAQEGDTLSNPSLVKAVNSLSVEESITFSNDAAVYLVDASDKVLTKVYSIASDGD